MWIRQGELIESVCFCVYQYINVFMLNNGPSVAGLYIASAAPTNISTVELNAL